MAGKLTIPCTTKQYEQIIRGLKDGIPGIVRPNEGVAIALQVEANTGLRITDVLNLKMSSFVLINGKYRFNMIEQKTKKKRQFFVQKEVYKLIDNYRISNGLNTNEKIFLFTTRNVQKTLKKVCDYYDIPHISSHSFRKMFATRAYEYSNYDIELVRKLMQHSSSAITVRYLGIQDVKIEKVLKKLTNIIE